MAEVGSLTTNRVSAYQRVRIFASPLMPGEKRTLETDLNAILPIGVTLSQVKWTMQWNYAAVMSNPVMDTSRRKASITIQAQYAGRGRMRVDATATNGDVYTNWQVVNVQAAPWITGFTPITGPQTLIAT